MDRLSRRVVAAFAALLVLGVALILVGQALDDGDDEVPEDASPAPVSPHVEPDAEQCGIEVPELPGTAAAPVCSLGFGIAIPDDWNATRLDEESLERLSNAELSRPSFLPAARTVAATGAVFYAAGLDDGGTVSDLKVDLDEGVDTSPPAVRARAEAVLDDPGVDGATLVDGGDGGSERVDFRGTSPDAETGDDLEFHGAHVFVADGDRLWSLIVTAEDEARRDELVEIFTTSLTFA